MDAVERTRLPDVVHHPGREVDSCFRVYVERSDEVVRHGQLGGVGRELACHRRRTRHQHPREHRTLEGQAGSPVEELGHRPADLHEEEVGCSLPRRDCGEPCGHADAELLEARLAFGEAPRFKVNCRGALLRSAQATTIDELEQTLGLVTRMIVDSGPLSGEFLPSLSAVTQALEKRRRHLALNATRPPRNAG